MEKHSISGKVRHRVSQVSDRLELPGHVRRARQRFDKAISGSKPEDIFVQAAVGAVATSLCLRVLRIDAINRAITRLVPAAVFAVLYQRLQSKK